jgi:hypothetical protein
LAAAFLPREGIGGREDDFGSEESVLGGGD